MCAIKEKWESSSSNYQHTKSNILWEDWELSFCKLSVLIWAEDATRVCLVFRVALCGEKFSKKFFWIINYWRVAWRNDAWSSFLLPYLESTQTHYTSVTNQKSCQLIWLKHNLTMHHALLPKHKWWLNLRISWNETGIHSCNLCFIF